ncbi:MAG: type II secretion system F family protein [Candidatus Woesearchaeota archaeon]
MKNERIPFVYFPLKPAVNFSKRAKFISNFLNKIFPDTKFALKTTNLKYKTDEFFTHMFFNSILWFIFISIFLFSLLIILEARSFIESIYFALGLGFFLFFIILLVTIRYPSIIAGKKTEEIEKNLVFALKDLLLQVSAGKPLFDSMVAVSKANYGQVSLEFDKTAKNVQSGMSMEKALEEMVLRNNSDFLKRTVWQILNVIKSGSNLKTALKIVIDDMLSNHKDKIKGYAQELNMWSLIYMLFAVAIPTIGSTVMLILTSFSGGGLNEITFITFGVMCLFVQIIIIGLIQSRRPAINM